MKIALVSEHASPLAARNGLGTADAGGQNVFVADLAARLGALGHHVTVYTRRDDPRPPDRVRLAPGVTVEHVPAGPAEAIPKDELLPLMPDFGRHLERSWAEDPPDVAHAHFWMSGLATAQAVENVGRRRIPMVQTYHALGTVKRRHQREKDTSPPGRPQLERALGHTAEAVIATCADETEELVRMGVPRDRITVVPCGVDLAVFRPDGPRIAKGRRPRLVALSRLVERKGVDTAIRALARVPGAELLVAGGPRREDLDGDPEVRRLRAVAAECGVADRVRFLGRVGRAQAPRLLRSADLVVALPWYEPFGMVPLEAMACGVPVVATAVGGHLDTIIDGVTGVHVAPRTPEQTARVIRALLADPTRRAAMGFAGSDRARSRYSWDRIAQETLTVYRRAMTRSEVLA
ncbi:glycosyl transferase [Actinomadura rubrobrunea]|uniref:Glycosyl transferase n=1 Tax=Actinomadura rubrobrunea TaxID=115335 RepID=A0A9W6Q2L4_9ACTN|nr:glycosyltransferase [Actinomadura rubrobrunea]GLW67393.1 glycosyl transferase [Actinomadura rubrobrunea]